MRRNDRPLELDLACLPQLVAVPHAGREGEYPRADAWPPGVLRDTRAVGLQARLAHDGVVGRLDPLAGVPERIEAGSLVLAVGRLSVASNAATTYSNSLPAKPFPGDDELTLRADLPWPLCSRAASRSSSPGRCYYYR